MLETQPSGAELVALARARLADELRALDALSGAALWQRLIQSTPKPAVSRGALVHYIRRALEAGETTEAEALFIALTLRIEGLTQQWIRRTVLSARLTLAAADWREHAADLAQEHTLRLWSAVTRADGAAWELFFGRALAYMQRHIADTWRRRTRSQAPPISLGQFLTSEDEQVELALSAPEQSDELSQVELSDLRALVARLPERERLVIVLRYWACASEDVIAEALGGVTTRTVRGLLTRAYALLRVAYSGGEFATQIAGEAGADEKAASEDEFQGASDVE
jgi:RNA polymerase sigma factor (sigma-70 family)